MPKTAQIFSDNGHRAIRLPDDVHLRATEVEIRQDDSTGAITLIPRENPEQQFSWEHFFKLRDAVSEEERAAFEIPRDHTPPEPRDII